jgi:hypothetical protein
MCDKDFDDIRKIESRETAKCSCGRIASKVLSIGSNLHIDCVLEPYLDNGLGVMIKSSKHRKEIMRSKGLEEA